MPANYNNNNPENHPTIQALLDLRKQGFQQADEILRVLTDDSDEMRKQRAALKALWNSHQYPDRKLTFMQSVNYDGCPQRFAASIEAQSLFGLMERVQSKDGIVAVKKGIFAAALGFGSVNTRKLQVFLDELESIGLITALSKPKKGSQMSAIYQVNQSVSWIGKRGGHLNPNSKDKDAVYMQVIEEAVVGDVKIKCGTLGEWQEPEEPMRKRRKRAGTTKESASPKLISHDHDTAGENSLSRLQQMEITDFIPEPNGGKKDETDTDF